MGTFNNNKYIELLSKLSIGDTSHDFKGELNDFNINSKLKEQKFRDLYCKALFEPCSGVNISSLDEKYISTLVFKEKKKTNGTNVTKYNISDLKFAPSIANDLGIAYSKDTIKNQAFFNTLQSSLYSSQWNDYEITTVNDFEYKVKASVVLQEYINKNEVYKQGIDVIDELGIDNSILIIDTAAFNIFNLLNTNNTTNNTKEREIYYVYTSEATNDPGSKTIPFNLDTHKNYFNISTSNVKIHALSDEIIDAKMNDKYNIYNFKKHDNDLNQDYYKDLDPYNLFYTNYEFKLSYMNKINNGFVSSLNTKFKITDNKTKYEHLEDSINNPNSIRNSSKKLIELLPELEKTKSKFDDNMLEFNINRLFLQKRSGDWLQVLSCKDVKNRELTEYTALSDNKSLKTEIISKNKLNDKRVYFVTIDRLALSYALLNGINCIYANSSTYSYYSFTLTDELIDGTDKYKNSKTNSIINKLNKIKDITIKDIPKYKEGVPDYKEETTEYKEFKRNKDIIRQYIIFYEKKKVNYTIIIDKIIYKIKLTFDLYNAERTNLYIINIDESIKFIKLLFKACYEYSLFLNTYPFVDTEMLNKYNDNYDNLSKIIDEIWAANATSLDTSNYLLTNNDNSIKEYIKNNNDKITELINIYNEFKSSSTSFKKIIEHFYDSSTTDAITSSFLDKIKLKTNKNYRSIDSWNWNIRTSIRRTIDHYKYIRNIKEDSKKSHNLHRNYFLYEITKLPSNTSKKVVDLFSNLYDNIFKKLDYQTKQPIMNEPYQVQLIPELDETETIRFYPFIRSFCIEVFISLGGLTDINSNIETMINEYLKNNKMNNIDSSLTDSVLTTQLHLTIKDSRENAMLLSSFNEEIIDNIINDVYKDVELQNEKTIKELNKSQLKKLEELENQRESQIKSRRVVVAATERQFINKDDNYKRAIDSVETDFKKRIDKIEQEEGTIIGNKIKTSLSNYRKLSLIDLSKEIQKSETNEIKEIDAEIKNDIETITATRPRINLFGYIINKAKEIATKISENVFEESKLNSFLRERLFKPYIYKNSFETVKNISNIQTGGIGTGSQVSYLTESKPKEPSQLLYLYLKEPASSEVEIALPQPPLNQSMLPPPPRFIPKKEGYIQKKREKNTLLWIITQNILQNYCYQIYC